MAFDTRMTWRRATGAGRRDRLVALVPQAASSGGSGYPVDTDETPIELYAARLDVDAREGYAAGAAQITAPVVTRWEIPYLRALDPEREDLPGRFYLMCDGHRFDITGAAVIGRRMAIELLTLARSGT
jgi:hypothetical protein